MREKEKKKGKETKTKVIQADNKAHIVNVQYSGHIDIEIHSLEYNQSSTVVVKDDIHKKRSNIHLMNSVLDYLIALDLAAAAAPVVSSVKYQDNEEQVYIHIQKN